MNSTTTISPQEKFLETFSHNDSFQDSIKVEALNNFKSLEFPTTRHENWKYTKVTAISKSDFKLVKPSLEGVNLDQYFIKGLDAYKLVFVNGFFIPEKSDAIAEDNISVGKIYAENDSRALDVNNYYNKRADNKSQIFSALNTAFNTDATYIHIAPNFIAEKPIHIVNLINGDDVLSQPRLLIVAEKNSQAKVLVTYETIQSKKAFTNVVVEVYVKENARLAIDKIQNESDETSHISTEEVYQEANSNFTINTITLSGGLVRNNLNIVLDAEGCEANLNGLYLTKNKQHVDNHTLVDHKKPNCQSNELYKGIMDDDSTAVFNGKVFVRRDAQKTNAYQSNKNVLLSNNATINAKPELEIYADDVKCSHGSTTGQLDEEAIFYFQARGIGKEQARNLMMYAFASDVIENIKLEPLKEKVNEYLDRKFN